MSKKRHTKKKRKKTLSERERQRRSRLKITEVAEKIKDELVPFPKGQKNNMLRELYETQASNDLNLNRKKKRVKKLDQELASTHKSLRDLLLKVAEANFSTLQFETLTVMVERAPHNQLSDIVNEVGAARPESDQAFAARLFDRLWEEQQAPVFTTDGLVVLQMDDGTYVGEPPAEAYKILVTRHMSSAPEKRDEMLTWAEDQSEDVLRQAIERLMKDSSSVDSKQVTLFDTLAMAFAGMSPEKAAEVRSWQSQISPENAAAVLKQAKHDYAKDPEKAYDELKAWIERKQTEKDSNLPSAALSSEFGTPTTVDAEFMIGALEVVFETGLRQQIFPVVEIWTTTANTIVQIPAMLDIELLPPKKSNQHEFVIFDPNDRAHPVLQGTVAQNVWLVFQYLKDHWDFWFLRTSNNLRQSHMRALTPSPGQEHHDYQITIDRVARRLANPVHMAFTAMMDAAMRGRRSFLTAIKKALIEGGRDVKEALDGARDQRDKLEKLGGPLPWAYDQTQEKTTNHKIILRSYLDALRSAGDRAMDDTRNAQDDRKFWAVLKRAKIFEFDARTYNMLHHMADVYTTEHLSGADWENPDGDPDAERSEEEVEIRSQHYAEVMMEAAKSVPFPNPLPFDVCYFGWGSGVPLGDNPWTISAALASQVDEYDELYFFATLISDRGEVWGLFWIVRHGERLLASLPFRYAEGSWENFSLQPWIIMAVVENIKEHKTIIESTRSFLTSGERRKFERIKKKYRQKKLLPPPFYPVYLKDKVIRRTTRKTWEGTGLARSYRSDVIGHDRLYYKRGKLPIDPDVEEKLRKYDYGIYTVMNKMPSKIYQMLVERGKAAPTTGEWVAAKVVWVDGHISPANPELPYIPSTRKTTKGVTATKDVEDGPSQ